MRDHFYTPFLQLMLPDLFFNKIKCKIQQHGNDAEDHNGHQDPCKSECLASVNDQVSQAFSGTDKFSDDHAYQAKQRLYGYYSTNKRCAQALILKNLKLFSPFQYNVFIYFDATIYCI